MNRHGHASTACSRGCPGSMPVSRGGNGAQVSHGQRSLGEARVGAAARVAGAARLLFSYPHPVPADGQPLVLILCTCIRDGTASRCPVRIAGVLPRRNRMRSFAGPREPEQEGPMRTWRMLGERRIKPAWVLLLALLALPDCTTRYDDFVVGGPRIPPPRIPPGTTLVPCDLHLNPDEPTCAMPDDLMNGVRLAEAAIALVQGDKYKFIGIDDSPQTSQCATGPEAIVFQGEYPAGLQVCVDPEIGRA